VNARRREASHRVALRQKITPAPFKGGAVKRLVREAAVRLSPPGSDLRVLVVGDAEMEGWNRRVFDRPRTTNVISFPEGDPGGPGRLAGDIVVSADTCLRQTEGWPGSPEERLFFFVLHGMLHIAGYDHEGGAAEARRMRRKETALYDEVLRCAGGEGR
jgi:probable rRNA maturation factor